MAFQKRSLGRSLGRSLHGPYTVPNGPYKTQSFFDISDQQASLGGVSETACRTFRGRIAATAQVVPLAVELL